uniref:BTB domain-containing protein n=1 Tax=Parastrongyloides trichosuri TaxID=131310 RepID=A0A0N4Z439_PARTI
MLNNKHSQESVSGEVTLDSFHSDGLKELLRYLYTGELSESWQNIEMLVVADHLQIDSLKSYVENCLIQKIDESNVGDYLRHAVLYRCDDLKLHCKRYIRDNPMVAYDTDISIH